MLRKLHYLWLQITGTRIATAKTDVFVTQENASGKWYEPDELAFSLHGVAGAAPRAKVGTFMLVRKPNGLSPKTKKDYIVFVTKVSHLNPARENYSRTDAWGEIIK